VDLGVDPDDLTVYLVYGGGFYQSLEASQPWPDGVALQLLFATASKTADAAFTWSATFDGVFASWAETPADVQAVLDGGATYVRLIYTDADGDDIPWSVGRTNAS
jgi:hypothetical protein